MQRYQIVVQSTSGSRHAVAAANVVARSKVLAHGHHHHLTALRRTPARRARAPRLARHAPRLRMRDLAASVILSRSGLTRLADRLEREGLIRRESCSSDARGAYAVLTEAGADRLAAARTTHLAGVRSLFLQHFSDDELDVLGDAWDRVVPGSASAPGPACG